MNEQIMERICTFSQESEANNILEMTDSVSAAPTPVVEIGGRSTKSESANQSVLRQTEKKRSKSQDTVEKVENDPKTAVKVREKREKSVIQGSFSFLGE